MNQEDNLQKIRIKAIDNGFYIASKIAEITEMEADNIQAVVNYCFIWAMEMTESSFCEIDELGCFAEIDSIIELINYNFPKELIAVGLSHEEQRCIKERILTIARDKKVPPSKLAQALIKKGIYYFDLKQYSKKFQIVLSENEYRLLLSGRFSRSDLDKWLYYVYLGSLFITEL